MNHILAFFDEDQTYSDRFKKFASTRPNCPFTVYSFHEYKDLKNFSQNHPIELLVGSDTKHTSVSGNYESLYSGPSDKMLAEADSLYTIPAKSIIRLSESPLNVDNGVTKNLSGNGKHEIYKYQSGENILREIMTVYGRHDVLNENRNDELSELFLVYSPIGRSGKTTFAKSLTKSLQKDLRPLYITLEEVSDSDAESDDNTCPGTLSEALYFYNEGNLTKERIHDLIHHSEGIDHILPVRTPEDLTALSPKELKDFIEHIRTVSDMDAIILDTDSILSRIEILFPYATRIFMPVTDDPRSCKKLSLLESYLNKTQNPETIDNIIKLIVPDPHHFNISEKNSSGSYDPISGYVQAVIENYIYQ